MQSWAKYKFCRLTSPMAATAAAAVEEEEVQSESRIKNFFWKWKFWKNILEKVKQEFATLDVDQRVWRNEGRFLIEIFLNTEICISLLIGHTFIADFLGKRPCLLRPVTIERPYDGHLWPIL